MTGEMHGRVAPRRLGGVAAIALAIVIGLLLTSALLTGPSLDDYWAVYLSDPARGFDKLIRHGWVEDIRPPFFNAWATALSFTGLTSIPIARLISNLPALLFLLYATKRFSRRLPDQSAYYGIFLLLVLSAPATIRAFGVYRADFWQLAAFAVQMLLARHILFVDKDYRSRDDGMLALIGLIATLAAILLDYGGALFGGITAMATALVAIARGFRRWARSILITLALGIGGVIYAISWQAPAWTATFDLYQNWIEMGSATAGSIVIGLLFSTIIHNPVAIGGAYIGRDKWDRGDTGFVIMTGAALIASMVAIIQIDSQRRLVTSNNTADIAVLVTALMATAGAKVARKRLWINALAGVAVLSSIAAVLALALGGAWQVAAKKISRTVAACPGTQVYAASGWRLDDAGKSRTADHEEPVFRLGYRKLAEAHGFKSVLLDRDRPVTVTPNGCPVVIWIEQVPERKHPKPKDIIKATGLKGLDPTTLKIERTETGLIARAKG